MTNKPQFIADGAQIIYDPNPGGTKNPDGTTSYSLAFPILTITEWVSDREKVAQAVTDALNRGWEHDHT